MLLADELAPWLAEACRAKCNGYESYTKFPWSTIYFWQRAALCMACARVVSKARFSMRKLLANGEGESRKRKPTRDNVSFRRWPKTANQSL